MDAENDCNRFCVHIANLGNCSDIMLVNRQAVWPESKPFSTYKVSEDVGYELRRAPDTESFVKIVQELMVCGQYVLVIGKEDIDFLVSANELIAS